MTENNIKKLHCTSVGVRGYLRNLVRGGDVQVISIARNDVKERKRKPEDVTNEDNPEKRGKNSSLRTT